MILLNLTNDKNKCVVDKTEIKS